MMFSLTSIEKSIKEEERKEEEDFQYELDDFLKITIQNCDDNQLKVLNSEHDKYIVYGTAGSGKSMLAMRIAMTLYNEEKDFSFNIYTKALAKYLIGRLKKAKLNNIKEHILCGEKLNPDDIKDSDYIIVDEVQDFNKSQLESIFDLNKKGYYLFGDDGQQIYPGRTDRINIIKYLIEDKKIPNYKLLNTYRFPKKIALFSENIKSKKENLSSACLKEGGNENIPKIIEFKTKEDEVRYIDDIIKKEGWKDVGILVTNNDDVKEYFDLMRKIGLTCDYKDDTEERLDFSNNRPKIITYHSSKGLEFERVFIPNCYLVDETSKLNYREALYVACTRASKTLIVSYIKGNKSPYLDKIDNNYYNFEKR